jgi:ATP/maltotriose-dependent transcriptional regulator MalT
VGPDAGDAVERARAALRAGDAATARRIVEEPAGPERASGAVLEVLARADYLDREFARAIDGWERAYAAYRAEADAIGAIRVARTIAAMYFSVVGDFAVSGGWLARAQTLLGSTPDPSERGWVALNLGMFEPDRSVKDERFREALADARAAGDPELEVSALAYLGASLVAGGSVEEGMRLLDEALAAVAGAEVDDFCVVEEVFCQLFSACEHAGDVARADQWMRVGDAMAARRNLSAVAAFCCTHYGGVLTAAGRWPEADVALSEAVRLWGLGQRSSLLRGGALVRLADLRVRQGRYEEAERLLADLAPAATGEAIRPLAMIHLAKGELSLARELLERALESLDPTSGDAAPLLELLVEVHLSAGDVDAATTVLDRLLATAEDTRSPYVRALAAFARGQVCAATATGDPADCLRRALDGFHEAQMPLEQARARLELAGVLAEDRPEVARAEARAALSTFEDLKAARYADAAAAVLRTLGVRPSTTRQPDGVLTKREAEVLALLAQGRSNPEIAEQLFISRKTVEHHVGNVLAKLGLRNRAEAAAYVLRTAAAERPEPAAD